MVTVFHMVTIVSMVTIVPIVPLMVPSVAGVVAALAGAPVVQHQVGQGVAITFILAILWILAMAIVLAIIVILMVITVMTGTISHITGHRTAAHTSHCGLWGGPATLVILDISVIYLSRLAKYFRGPAPLLPPGGHISWIRVWLGAGAPETQTPL